MPHGKTAISSAKADFNHPDGHLLPFGAGVRLFFQEGNGKMSNYIERLECLLLIDVPDQNQSTELKGAFKSHFQIAGLDAPLTPLLARLSEKFTPEWDEACQEAVRDMNEQVERNTMLLGRNQAAMAERAFEAYNFGEGMAVAGVSGWEYYAAGHERSREVYVENALKDGKKNPSTRLGFTVRYDPQTGALAEAYAEDATGSAFGCMPEGQLEKLNADSAVAKVEPPTATLSVLNGNVSNSNGMSLELGRTYIDPQLENASVELLSTEVFGGFVKAKLIDIDQPYNARAEFLQQGKVRC